MVLGIFALISGGVFIIFLFDALIVNVKQYKSKRLLTPYRSLCLGTLISAISWFLPAYYYELSSEGIDRVTHVVKTFLTAAQNAIRLFAMDDGYLEAMAMLDSVEGIPETVYEAYAIIGGVLFLVAPVLTFGFILSFFKNLSSYTKYLFSLGRDVHIFSELNDRSLALASSINEKYNRVGAKKRRNRLVRRAVIVFAGIQDNVEDERLDAIEEAKELGAVLFRKDICAINFRKYGARQNFYLIGTDEAEKIRRAASIVGDYGKRRKTKLYVFSDNVESRTLLDSYTEAEIESMEMEVIRVNDIRSLIYHNLHLNGLRLFENANSIGGGEREISAVVVGFGRYGVEMTKALLWYAQIPGYRVRITAFDGQEGASSRFKALCPEIELGAAVDRDGDMKYTLNVVETKVGTKKFLEEIEKIPDTTYVFVCLGSDSLNISTAMDIRARLAKQERYPDIETVVYDSSLKERVGAPWCESERCSLTETDLTSQKIHIIGDIRSFYSEGTVINSDLIERGFEVHARWRGENDAKNNYYMNDYNYFSSLASALHRSLRRDIAKYSDADRRAEVFPAFYGDTENMTPEYRMRRELLMSVISAINDNESIRALSAEICAFADVMYSKIGRILYGGLDIDGRRAVLERALKKLRSRKATEAERLAVKIPMLDGCGYYTAGYDEMLGNYKNLSADGRKTLRLIYDYTVEYKAKDAASYEEKRKIYKDADYAGLSADDRRETDAFVRSVLPDADIERYLIRAECFADIEHIRWNAYMRTEGFSRSLNTKREYKLHFDLVPVEMLTFADCIKDI